VPIERHPWNESFRWVPARGPFRRISDAQAEAWNTRGFFLLEDAFDPEALGSLEQAIDPFEAQVTAFLRGRPDGRLFIADADAITFTTHLVTRSERCREFCRSPVFQDLAHDLIGPDVRLYWDQAVYKKPGTRKDFPWHQDNGYTFLEPQQYLTCWVAVSDATEQNGCPWVVPGLHRSGTLRHWMTDAGWRCLAEPEHAVPVPARAGSIVVFSSLTPHSTGGNQTASVRKAYIVQFAPDGAETLVADGAGGCRRTRQHAPDRQFFVLRGVTAPQAASRA
jgi:ectoine hydroxylase-related dioxygenase (phytanoyl-CoA dioxygenase family)